MTCRDVASFLLEYVAGELPENIAGVFEAHLAACENCRAFLDQYRKTMAAGRIALGDAMWPAPPPELIDGIVASLAEARRE